MFSLRHQLFRGVRTSCAKAFSSFPSLTIRANELVAQGTFAEAQADYLLPDQNTVAQLDKRLHHNNVGVVAHFYMDPELQGVLQAVSWPHVFIADSLAMGDAAVKMAEQGVKAITVLGVDFMSENVQAFLRAEGHHTPVYRLSEKHIGCSLAESAEGANYAAYLERASQTPDALHVVYINTSLRTKANAQRRLPTITCTSSNVVNTILQASAQIPNVSIFFGPDTFMGENLVQTFQHLSTLSDSQITQVHPQHNKQSVLGLLERFEYFRQGNCVVHHMFDEKVTQRVHDEYKDAFLTAHFEVPGAMFELSLAAQAQGRGRVGSTSDILNAITKEVVKAVNSNPTSPIKLSFILGTEAGMITGIVRQVQAVLRKAGNPLVEAEIIFPVASTAISRVDDSELSIVPGVTSGEGCSSAGGCATCPFMKMNSLDSLLRVVELCEFEPELELSKYLIQARGDPSDELTRTGVIPISHMRAFQTGGRLSSDLVRDVISRHSTRLTKTACSSAQL